MKNMFNVKTPWLILEKTELEFENNGVMNPAVIKEGKTVHMFYRAVKKINYSSIGYCKLEGPDTIRERLKNPVLIPSDESESEGVEDPRIVKIADTYYLSYIAFDGANALGSLAISNDLKNFEKRGIIVPQLTYEKFTSLLKSVNHISPEYFTLNETSKITNTKKKVLVSDKDVMFFPRRINDRLAFLHRIRPAIQIVYFNTVDDLTEAFWEEYFLNFKKFIVLEPKYAHEALYIGGGCPPIETKDGWLFIYHGVENTPKGNIYNACAALLDLENPSTEIARLKTPLFSPALTLKNGIVSKYVFPTGTALFDDDLYIYYGRDDFCVWVSSVKLSELLTELKNNMYNRA